MEVRWKHLAIALAVLPIAAVAIAWIGFFNIGASSGHWKITDWFLHFAMRSAVRTYALGIETPPRLPRENLQAAAGHFARGCAGCHGAPGEARSPTSLRMLPQPPDLQQKVAEWTDAQLFWIVKHGIRFTGMPAWPTQARDDEVWTMVAFLREQAAMTPETYRQLAYGESGRVVQAPENFESSLAECARCHGTDGLGRGEGVPIIAGQSEAYLLDSLRAFARGGRHSGAMSLPAVAVKEEHWPRLARHYSGLPAGPGPIDGAMRDASPGAQIVFNGLPDRGVPACSGCHGSGGTERNPAYPLLVGQRASYVAAQLRLFRGGQRGGTPYAHLMRKAAEHLSEREIDELAAFLSGLDPANATGRQ